MTWHFIVLSLDRQLTIVLMRGCLAPLFDPHSSAASDLSDLLLATGICSVTVLLLFVNLFCIYIAPFNLSGGQPFWQIYHKLDLHPPQVPL